MPRYKIIEDARCQFVYYFDAENEDEARKQYDDSELGGKLDENSFDDHRFRSLEEMTS